jgi:N-acetylmuramoyl-L-alanine amidase
MSKQLFIIAGHSTAIDPGATSTINGVNYKEADLAVEFRDLLIEECKTIGLNPITDSKTNALKQTLEWLKSKVFQPTDIMVDIHWNAGPPAANGTEVIIPDNASQKERNLAKDVYAVLSKYWKPRRILKESETPRKRLGIFRPNMEQILIEMCFISNAADMNTYQKVKRSLAKEIAQVLYKHYMERELERVYIIQKGDNLLSISRKVNVPLDTILLKNNLKKTDKIFVGQKLIL